MDKLNDIFAKQKQLMRKYDLSICSDVFTFEHELINDPTYQVRLRQIVQFTIEELCEATHLLKNKPWRKLKTKTNVELFYEELADVLHFYVELCATCGITAEKLYKLYTKKAAVNAVRQDGDY